MPHFIQHLNGHIQHPSVGADSKLRFNARQSKLFCNFSNPLNEIEYGRNRQDLQD
jgi:hypothetical protein